VPTRHFSGSRTPSTIFRCSDSSLLPPPDRLVEDGDIIKLGNEQLQVIHTPGHTPGGICLLCGQDLLTGDTLFVGGIGRTDFPGGSHQQLMNSIKDRLMVLPDDTIVWPGHGYGGSRSTLGEELKTNPYL
jgi:glyoxylase-like metal-dependent hydrolase (beta-lactamase superfamily II)